MYGAQARYAFVDYKTKFENDVEMYGAQATETFNDRKDSLRMM